jgi:sugar phosphate isomerase/epimerase
MGVLENPETAVKKLAPYAFCNHFCDHKLDRDQFGIRFHGVALGDGDIDCFKTYQTIRELSPTDRITFEIEWDMGETPWKSLGKKRWMPASGASNMPVKCSRLEVSDMRLFRNNQTPASRNATSYD